MLTLYIQQIILLLKRLSVIFLAYFVSRLLFFFFNRNYFPNTGYGDLLLDSLHGLRFDAFSIVVSNSLFILISILPFRMVMGRAVQRILLVLFVITNTVFLAANFVDVAYFDFTHKRSTADLFNQLGGQTDVLKLLPRFLADFWPVLLVFILCLWLMTKIYRMIRMPVAVSQKEHPVRQKMLIALIFLLCTGLSVLAVRGGLQRVPIDIVNAGAVTRPEGVPIVLNTPFTLIKSHNQRSLPELRFYSDEELAKLYSPLHHYNKAGLKKENVVVLILESFSKEYTSLGRKMNITPFLDSLMRHSLVFTNAFSNGTKSIEGVPAILSSLPSLMDNPFINSLYANNVQTSFASVLADEGYSTAFFHGGINGTMNFDDWAALAGYSSYYGKDEYMDDKDFDGYWGIWDEPFLQYSVLQMNRMKKPFHAAVFTLSSHHPYFVPPAFRNKFPKGELENSQSIQYADYSLRKFFETAKKTDWYKNTTFVLVADHCGISSHPYYSNVVGNLSIPVLFFKPDNSLAGTYDSVFSQIDILPTLLDLQGYNKPFFAFGSSAFGAQKPLPSFYTEGSHIVYGDSLTYFYNQLRPKEAYNYRRDSLLSTNILNKNPVTDSLITSKFKAFLQSYHATLISNSGTQKKIFTR